MAESLKMKKKCVSATAETEKTPQNGFSNPWKWEKRLKTAFQPLGNGKKSSKQHFNPLEMEETPQNGFPTPWKWRKCFKRLFQPLGSGKMDA